MARKENHPVNTIICLEARGTSRQKGDAQKGASLERLDPGVKQSKWQAKYLLGLLKERGGKLYVQMVERMGKTCRPISRDKRLSGKTW